MGPRDGSSWDEFVSFTAQKQVDNMFTRYPRYELCHAARVATFKAVVALKRG